MENIRNTGPAITEQHLQQTDFRRNLGETALSTTGTSATIRSRANDGGGMPSIAAEPWTKDALCAQTDPEAFFLKRGEPGQDAKKICAACDVTEQCLEYAIRTDQAIGVWGGKNESELRALKKRR